MRIIIDGITDNARMRGPDRYLVGLLSGLASIDDVNEYLLFRAPWQDYLEAAALPDNFRWIVCEPPRNNVARVLWHALVLPRILRRYHADLVHLPNTTLVAALDVPVVMTIHDLAHYTYPEKYGYFRGYTKRALIRHAVRSVSHVIAVSRYTQDEIERFLDYPAERVTVIGEGGPEPVDLPRLPDSPRYFLYVGQIERSKNIEMLVRAFLASESLRDSGAELWIAGPPGNAMGAVQALLSAAPPGRVRLLGYVPEDELPGLYRNALALVFPSLIEGFGLVLLEAMAYGTAVISSSSSVIPEVVGDAGLLVDTTDIDALRTAMERMCSDSALRADLIVRGRARLKQYSWLEAARQTLAVYQNEAGIRGE